MSLLICFLISITTAFLINLICNHYNFLVYDPKEFHKEKFDKKIFVNGGLITFVYSIFIYILFYEILKFNYIYVVYFLLIFLLGFLSDLTSVSANKRLALLSLITILFVYLSSNNITDLKFNILNDLFNEYFILSIIFTALCLVILINGLNFIDGVHGLAILYCIITILFLNFYNYQILGEEISSSFSIKLLPVLIVIFYLNLKEKIFFGDCGAYYLGAFLGIIIIDQTNIEKMSNPYLYANLLIYPSFEIFFSIFRKLLFKNNPLKPDQEHLHQLLQQYFIKTKNSLSRSKILSGLSINCLIIFFNILAIIFHNYKFYLIFNIFGFSLIYLFLYMILKKRIN